MSPREKKGFNQKKAAHPLPAEYVIPGLAQDESYQRLAAGLPQDALDYAQAMVRLGDSLEATRQIRPDVAPRTLSMWSTRYSRDPNVTAVVRYLTTYVSLQKVSPLTKEEVVGQLEGMFRSDKCDVKTKLAVLDRLERYRPSLSADSEQHADVGDIGSAIDELLNDD